MTVVCIILTVVTAGSWIIGQNTGSGGEIFFGYMAFIIFLFVSLPFHLLVIVAALYLGFKYKAHKQLLIGYVYYFIWALMHIYIFHPFIVTGVPELIDQTVDKYKYEKENELYFSLIKHESEPEKVRELIEAGVDVNRPDNSIGMTPLIWASRQGNAEIVEMLIKAGAEVNLIVNMRGSTGRYNEVNLPVFTALNRATNTFNNDDRLAVVEVLLKYGAEVDRGAPILGACAFGDIVVFERLLQAGAAYDVKDTEFNTCGHIAAHNNEVAMLDYLIANNMIIDSKTTYKQTPLDEAINRNHEEAALKLVEAGYRTTRLSKLQYFLNKEPNTETKDRIRELHQ